VPAQTAANSTTTLTDTSSDIATTGTVTFSNPSFDLGVLTGTVTAQYDGGASGGTITNCAHLKGTGSTSTVGGFKFPNVPGVDLEACNTQSIPPANSCTPGTVGCGWHDGDLVTYTQDLWGATPAPGNAAQLLFDNYNTVYASTFGVVEVGLSGSAGYSIIFDSRDSVFAYLPASGSPGPLTSDLLDPTSSAAGSFGGEVLALRFNIDFSDAGLTTGTSGLHFGDLSLCGFSGLPALNGMKVRDFLGQVNSLLGGGPATYGINELEPMTVDLGFAFSGGTADVFAQDHLVNGACPAWQNGALTTYSQDDWGNSTSTAGQILTFDFGAVYPGGVGVGIPGTAGFSMQFSGGSDVIAYLPASGTPGPLTADVSDATSSSSGEFGGLVLSLQLDVDLGDTGYLAGSSTTKFGDLTVCNVTTLPAVNGLTVRQILADANTLLGGGSSIAQIGALDPVIDALTGAFEGGAPSVFAQQHLVNGACH